jgi:hypothetical protein
MDTIVSISFLIEALRHASDGEMDSGRKNLEISDKGMGECRTDEGWEGSACNDDPFGAPEGVSEI